MKYGRGGVLSWVWFTHHFGNGHCYIVRLSESEVKTLRDLEHPLVTQINRTGHPENDILTDDFEEDLGNST